MNERIIGFRPNLRLYLQEDKPETRENYMSSTLVIMRFDTPLEGEYTCIASNVFRMKKKSITITGQCVAGDALSYV